MDWKRGVALGLCAVAAGALVLRYTPLLDPDPEEQPTLAGLAARFHTGAGPCLRYHHEELSGVQIAVAAHRLHEAGVDHATLGSLVGALYARAAAAKPKIAEYAFNTLTPNLGVVAYRDNQSFVMADIPGIIEGAAEGKGLGPRFLRHIERNSLLLFMIPADANDLREEYEILLNELRKYNPELLDKKRLLAISKSDLLDDELREAMKKEVPAGIPWVFISAVTNSGIAELKDLIWKHLHS